MTGHVSPDGGWDVGRQHLGSRLLLGTGGLPHLGLLPDLLAAARPAAASFSFESADCTFRATSSTVSRITERRSARNRPSRASVIRSSTGACGVASSPAICAAMLSTFLPATA